MPNNIAVSITADVADLQVKRAIMSAELKAATKDLNAFAREAASSGSTDTLRQGMLASATAAEKAKASIAQVNAELKAMAAESAPAVEHVEHGIAGLSIGIREMGVSVRESIGMLGEMREAAAAFGEAMIAAFAVEEIKRAAEKMGEAAERTKHLSQILGVSTQQVQQLRGAAEATGIDFDALVHSMTLMDRKFETAPESFRKLGIEVKNGATQMQLLEAVMNRFKGLDDGPQKAALAFQTMGRAGAQMIPFLSLGADGLAELNRKSEEYGVVSDDATTKGLALAESVNESKLAWDGLGNTMTSVFAPMLKGVVDDFNTLAANITKSYNEGGGWAVVFEIIEGILSTLKGGLADVGDAFGGLFSSSGQKASDWSTNIKWYFNQVAENGTYMKVQFVQAIDQMVVYYHIFLAETLVWWSGVKTTYEEFLNWVDKIEAEVSLLGIVVQEALSLQWGKIAQTWDAGMAQIQNVVAQRGAAIVREAANFRIQAAKEMAAAGGVSADFTKWAMQQIAPPPAGKTGIEGVPPTPEGPPVDFSKDKKPKKAQSRMSEWEEELSEKKMALQEEDEADSSFREMSKAEEASYWKNIRDTVKLSHSEMIEVKKKYYDASFAARKSDFDDQIAMLKRELDAAKGNLPEMQKIGDQIVTAYKNAYGDKSKEAQDAERQISDIMKRGADDDLRIQEELFKHIAELQQKRIAEEQKNAEFLNQMGVLSNGQLIAQEKQFEQERNQIARKALQDRLDIESKDPTRNKAAIAKTNRDIQDLEKDHQAKMNELDRKAILQRTQIERQAINQIAAGWSQAIGKMITLQQGFAATIKSLWQTVQQAIGDAIAKIIEQWIAKELTALAIKLGILKTDGTQTVATEAAKAGAGGVASMAAAPFPLNLTAPAFGTTMSAQAASYGAISAFDVGALDISRDQLAMVHSGETIIPADQAGGWRNVMGMFASMPKFSVPSAGFGAGANGNAPIAANDGASGAPQIVVHYNDHTTNGQTPDQIRKNHRAVADAVMIAHRKGMFPRFDPTA